MHHVTVFFGVILSAIGLFGYFASAQEAPSPTALIPAAFGVLLIIAGIVAHRAAVRMHAMHAAVVVGLLGFLMAAGRIAMKGNISGLFSDDVTVRRPVAMITLMALTCFIYVVLCVGSFIAARRRRTRSAAK